MVRPTSAADINSRPVAASPAAPMRNPDLLLRLSGRIVKGCRLPGSLAFRATLAKMTGASSSLESPRFPVLDFDALYRGESPAEGFPAVTTPPWNTKAPKENVIAWQEGGWVHGDVLDIGCGLGDNAIYLAKSGHSVTGLDISPTALITAERRATAARRHR